MMRDLEIVWNGGLDRAGLCPSICRYDGPSTLAGAIRLGHGVLMSRGDQMSMRTGAAKPQPQHANWCRALVKAGNACDCPTGA